MTTENNSGLSALLFYTHNVARALKPSVDGELAHAIHETLHFALDGEPLDYTLPHRTKEEEINCTGSNNGASTSTLNAEDEEEEDQIRPGFFESGDEERPFISYEWEEANRTLILPHPKTVTNPTVTDPCTSIERGTGVRDAFDVTAKFFFLGSEVPEEESYSVDWINEALKRFAIATGLDSVDTLILAFGGLEEQGKSLTAEKEIEKVASLWKKLSPNQQILSMGLSDFSGPALQSLVEKLQLGKCALPSSSSTSNADQKSSAMSSMTGDVQKALAKMDDSSLEAKSEKMNHVHIPSSPSKAAFIELEGGGEEVLKEYGPSNCRRPRLCAINLKEQNCGRNGSASQTKSSPSSNGSSNGLCFWDRDLAEYCKERNILLVAHSDRKDILPDRTLPTLMKEFDGKLPHPLPAGKRLLPLWCFKYTVLIRDRGVLADKGFLLNAKVVDDQ